MIKKEEEFRKKNNNYYKKKINNYYKKNNNYYYKKIILLVFVLVVTYYFIYYFIRTIYDYFTYIFFYKGFRISEKENVNTNWFLFMNERRKLIKKLHKNKNTLILNSRNIADFDNNYYSSTSINNTNEYLSYNLYFLKNSYDSSNYYMYVTVPEKFITYYFNTTNNDSSKHKDSYNNFTHELNNLFRLSENDRKNCNNTKCLNKVTNNFTRFKTKCTQEVNKFFKKNIFSKFFQDTMHSSLKSIYLDIYLKKLLLDENIFIHEHEWNNSKLFVINKLNLIKLMLSFKKYQHYYLINTSFFHSKINVYKKIVFKFLEKELCDYEGFIIMSNVDELINLQNKQLCIDNNYIYLKQDFFELF